MRAGNDPFVDSHVHFWNLARFDYEWLAGESDVLQQDRLPGHLRADVDQLDRLDLVGVVFVQADCRADQGMREVAWVHELADAGAPVLAIVAHAPVEHGTDCAGKLAELAATDLVTGVRRLLQDEPPGFATSPQVIDGVRLLAMHGLSFDLCVRQHQIDEVTRLVAACPEVMFVLDHLGKPVISPDHFAAWAAALVRLAALPNVRCKLSGLASEAADDARTTEALRPWLEHALAVFGPDRCMVGSDWPVVTSVSTYGRWFEVVLEVLDELSAGDRTRVLTATAEDTYDPLNRAARAKDPLPWL
ncbi:amidohydrolase [Aeromicrobium sp. 9AM]|uniref:amidohydrolase family protein n=1 Tax=Aeromicrobium sp. 9AM TaxID=2653126 RepID=UPI0012F34999|nr:amidohydrolase family protein [Aeromicrobium sp. 9AM]VXB12768.1 Amidohydrolase [Aeromicrobium sp. 9AM]